MPVEAWLDLLGYFDAVNFAPDVKCPVIMGLGLALRPEPGSRHHRGLRLPSRRAGDRGVALGRPLLSAEVPGVAENSVGGIRGGALVRLSCFGER